MDKIRAAVAGVAERVARSRPGLALRVLPQQAMHDDAERGQGLAEYALILAGIAIVAIASLIFLGGTITDLFWAPIDEEFKNILTMLGIG